MGSTGRTSLARILLLAVVLSALPVGARAATPAGARAAAPAGARAASAGAVDNRRTPPPGSATLPVRGPIPGGAGSGTPARADAFVPGRVLVGFEPGVGEGRRRAAAAAVGGRVTVGDAGVAGGGAATGGRMAAGSGAAAGGRTAAGSGVAPGGGRNQVVQLEVGADVRAVARELAGRPGVAFAEPDWIRRVDACEPEVCWHLQPRPGANVLQARQGGATGAGQTVAVVDTGVVSGVGDLDDQVGARLRCTGSGCGPAVATPTSSHGTEVASVIAAADDADGTTGVAPGATIVSYRVDGTGGGIPISHLRAALDHIAADDDIDVVNLSLGGSQWSELEREGIDAVLDSGKVVVASAGNTGDRVPQYPAAFPGVISVGATGDDGHVAGFSSFGKVDVVAPGDCVAVAEIAGFDQDRGCPGDGIAGIAFNSGTSFAAPIVSGVLALADSRTPLVARLALASSADEDSPDGDGDAKQWAHGLVDAGAFVDAHDPDAPPALVLETTGGGGDDHRIGSGDGQLPHPATTWVAYAFQAADGVAANPGTASFAGAASGTAAFAATADDPGTFTASLDSGPLDPGLRAATATATVDGEAATASFPVLALEADDQAPGVDLAGDDDDAWRRLDSVDGQDLDDVYAVTLGRGDRLDVTVAGLSADPVGVLLFDAGTEDVLGQLNRSLACGGGGDVGCPTAGLHYEAEARGTYLLDVYSTGSTGDYRLTWTVRNAAGLPIAVSVPACSPNGDGVRDRCAWTAGPIAGWTITSFVTSGAASAARRDGGGAHAWDGGDSAPGAYTLRVLYTEPGGRALLRAFALTLDERPPSIASATAAPNPFEPRPDDGDRDTTTFAMTSSERGRLRVVIYRYASTTVVRVLVSGSQAAGRQRLRWSGKTSSGAFLRGTFSYVIEATDAAGNTARSRRHRIRVL